MKNKRADRILSLFLMFQIFLAGTAFASPIGKVQEEKRNSEQNLSEVRREIEDLENQKEKILSEITAIDGKISDLLITIHVLEDEIIEKNQKIREAEAEYKAARKSETAQYEAMKKRIRYVYEKGDVTYLEILLKAKSMADAICENEYFMDLYQYDRKMLLNYKEIRDRAEELENRYREEEAEMEVMEAEYLAEKEALERSLKSKREEAADFDNKLKDAGDKAEVYAKAVKEQTEKLRQLRRAVPPKKTGTGIKSAGGSEKGREIADFALQFVGNPYVWGGTSLTTGADCSGFVQSVYKNLGISIPRTSAEQSKFGKKVSFEDLQPGDLVFYAGHVVMSIGDGRIVHASSAKEGIKVGNDVTYRTILDIRRPWET